MTISPILPVYNRADVTLDHGIGVYLYSTNGTKYLDFLSGIAVCALGHAHPHLVKALQDQAAKLWHISNIFYSEPLITLSERLVANSFADTVFFCNSGAEAIEGGIKAVRKYFYDKGEPHKNRIITFEGAFHGRTTAAIAASGGAKMVDGFAPILEGFDKVPVNIEAVKKAIGSNTAAILIEPVQGEGGISTEPMRILPELRKLCDEHNLLLFVDEIQCGVGRTGTLFAYEQTGVKPDIMTIAKGIGGGFPIGAFLMTEEVGRALKVGTHGTTFGGNPLGTAVGNAVLDVILEKAFLEHVKKISSKLKSALESLQNKYPHIISEIRGIGLMLGLKLKEPYENAKVVVVLRENKLLTNAAGQNVVRILPPLIIEEQHIEEAMDIIDKTLSQLKA